MRRAVEQPPDTLGLGILIVRERRSRFVVRQGRRFIGKRWTHRRAMRLAREAGAR